MIPDDMSEGTVKEGSGQDGDLDLSTPGPEDDVNFDAWRRLEDLMELPNMDAAIAHRRLLRQRLSERDEEQVPTKAGKYMPATSFIDVTPRPSANASKLACMSLGILFAMPSMHQPVQHTVPHLAGWWS